MPKPTVLMLKGLPASGKSTYAETLRSKGWHVISKDEIRKTISGEGKVIQERDRQIRYCILHCQDCVIDDTNLNPIHEERIRTLCTDRAIFEKKEFDITVEESIRRDEARGWKVGAAGIRSMMKWLERIKE